MRSVGDFDQIFAELPQIPGVWIFYRKNESKLASPNFIDFSNYSLNHIPLMEGEEKVTRLEFSNNDIPSIDNLVSLQNLINVNLSHNLLKEISNLENVPKLRMLDLSYNFINKI